MNGMIALLLLMSSTSYAVEATYNCSVSHYVGMDTKNYVEDIQVELDKAPTKAILPVSKELINISLSTFQTEPTKIDLYGQYFLQVRICAPKDDTGSSQCISSGGTFIGVDNAIQFVTSSISGIQTPFSFIGIQCNKNK